LDLNLDHFDKLWSRRAFLDQYEKFIDKLELEEEFESATAAVKSLSCEYKSYEREEFLE
jgi:hypothetical protein